MSLIHTSGVHGGHYYGIYNSLREFQNLSVSIYVCYFIHQSVCIVCSLCTFLFVMNPIGHYEIGKICAAMLVVAEHQEQYI